VTLLVLAWVSLGCAGIPTLLYLWNRFLFREPPILDAARLQGACLTNRDRKGAGISDTRSLAVAARNEKPATVFPSISVLIPARNEELGIEACVRSALASQHVELEVIVLDDASTDRTAEIVRTIAATDSRLRLETAPPLPEGWCGKQHACFALSKLARFDTFSFLDADVRLEPDALARMALFLKQSGAELVSGFPRQETGTLLEKLLIPLINWLLLSFLPLWGMRHFRWSAFGAGCGQWFMTSRLAYEKVGGHAAVKSSLHDGLTLPRAYRKTGFFTDVCDATHLATCRMYRSARGVWFGLAKNAREGMAATGQIWFWTIVLLCGQVVPVGLLLLYLLIPDLAFNWTLGMCPLLLSFGPRLAMTVAFKQSWLGALLHPVAIIVLLAVQWYTVLQAVFGKPVGWKGREAPTPRSQ